ncbi:phospholipase D domain protein [Streptococcus macacae NCTC 11558]|uniref:Cardiolipin synthase n=1 Tax=Streptococcus macacae NCTC 11558 TaxID=764298 RepID=G5JU75_9STRE|nr:phospholipase D domain protein [Streptococcus macacae NCTC 11558]
MKRLLKKGKRSILRGIFSRTTIIVFLILLQIFILISSVIWFRQYQIHFQILGILMMSGSILYLINSQMDTLSIITWLLVILPFPHLGTLFLIYTKQDWGYRELKSLIKQSTQAIKPYFEQDQEILDKLKKSHARTYNLAQYLHRSGGFPVYENTRVTYFSNGETKFEALKDQLLKAKKFIFLEYFIIAEGVMWGEILAILEQKVKEGVEVRVMYDGMLEFSTLSFDYVKRLQKIGINAKVFSPISPFVSTYYNYRDHRKILVIDNKVAFNGGINLADEYINQIERFGYWKDTAVMLEGEGVASFTLMFLQMWSTTNRDYEFALYLLPADSSIEAKGYVIPYSDSPLDHDKVGENVYIDILNQARDYVYIMTPYLILDSEMEHALKFAAERGVDVRIVMPGIPDKKVPYALAKRYYPALMESGVKIYEYTPGFVHAKVFVADNIKAVVGTINLDYRSLYHHFECATYMYQTDCIADIILDFKQTIKMSRRVTRSTLKKEKFSTKIIGIVVKLVAPLL